MSEKRETHTIKNFFKWARRFRGKCDKCGRGENSFSQSEFEEDLSFWLVALGLMKEAVVYQLPSCWEGRIDDDGIIRFKEDACVYDMAITAVVAAYYALSRQPPGA